MRRVGWPDQVGGEIRHREDKAGSILRYAMELSGVDFFLSFFPFLM